MTDISYQNELTAKAAESGANAAEQFREWISYHQTTAVVDGERIASLTGRAIEALNEITR